MQCNRNYKKGNKWVFKSFHYTSDSSKLPFISIYLLPNCHQEEYLATNWVFPIKEKVQRLWSLLEYYWCFLYYIKGIYTAKKGSCRTLWRKINKWQHLGPSCLSDWDKAARGNAVSLNCVRSVSHCIILNSEHHVVQFKNYLVIFVCHYLGRHFLRLWRMILFYSWF